MSPRVSAIVTSMLLTVIIATSGGISASQMAGNITSDMMSQSGMMDMSTRMMADNQSMMEEMMMQMTEAEYYRIN